MKRGGGRKGPRQPGGGKQTAGPRKGGRPVEGRGGRKDRFGGRGGKSRFEDERSERKSGGRTAGKSASRSAGKFGGERRDDKPRAAGDRPRGKSSVERSSAPLPPRSVAKRRGGAKGGPRPPSFSKDLPTHSVGFGGGRFNQDAPTPAAARPTLPTARERSPGEGISPELAAATKVQTVTVTPDENGMRVDRFFEARFPGLSFSHIQRIVRKGEVRVDGKRTEPKSRLEAGQQVRIPPLQLAAPRLREDSPQVLKDREYLHSITLAEDDDVLVLNKPMGLAVQGGSGTTRHVDGLLEALRGPGKDAQKPRLVHRLDKDTAGCLLIAKTRFAAAALAKTFRTRSARKIYWALVAGVPKPRQGRISTYLAKQEMEEDSFMRVAQHGERDAVHAVTYYAVVETSAQKLAWVSLKPVTGRTHQLRAHMAHIGNPIVGDPKYFNIENWELPGGIQNKLHLLARRIVVPHPRGGTIDVSAPLPPHMQQSWNLLGLDAERFDPIVDAPDED
ncbi:RluA family pseudouridine synthase [Pseudolabrys sp. FHR47]|uniref:RluA family pseudouridine synthase n=1 Tax=Pseudolabrys sp. FHR47 TaxID=2562284 RepID=UPI0010BEDCC6|nr:RluA family pseudouridine synthase [Pseudolabrys sp. FHR47]